MVKIDFDVTTKQKKICCEKQSAVKFVSILENELFSQMLFFCLMNPFKKKKKKRFTVGDFF